MSLVSNLKGWINMLFFSKAREVFNVESITSEKMDALVKKCANIYAGTPYWIDDEDHIKTINFAKSLCAETARLATLGIKITIDGSARAEWLQEQVDNIFFSLRHWVEYGCAFGTVVLKPNGNSIEVVTPDNFRITEQNGDEVTGIVFQDKIRTSDGKHWWHRLEHHHIVETEAGYRYMVSNRTFYSDSEHDLGESIDISKTPWRDLEEETIIEGAEGKLYAILRMPQANNIDVGSPLGLPIFHDAMEELRDLDIAYSRNALEIEQSKRTILLDSDRLLVNGGRNNAGTWDVARQNMGLPDMVKAVEGTGDGNFYTEINPTLQTTIRVEGIDALLSQIGYKVGFSNGYFVFNQSTGIQTATGVEAEQQRTIQYIKDVRDKLESCMENLIYALNAFADAYDLAPLGEYETNFNFGDITYNLDEDRQRWWSYVVQNKVPAWMYFEKFEGMTEEEAKAMVQEATPVEENPFPDEE